MAQRTNTRNNVLAGVFLIAAVLLGVLVSVVLSGTLENIGRSKRITVALTIAEGAAGLQSGSPVTLGGVSVGAVTRVTIERGDSGVPSRILVRTRIRPDITVHQDARILLVSPLLGSTSSLNIVSTGGELPVCTSNDIIEGGVAPPGFLEQAGYGPNEAARVRTIIENIDSLTTRLDGIVEDAEPRIDRELGEIERIIADLRTIGADLNERFPGWGDKIDSTLANAEEASARFSPLLDNAAAGVDDARSAIASAQRIVDDNREGIDNIVANVESASEKLDRETIDTLNKTLATADDGIARLAEVTESIGAWLSEEWPSVRKIIANGRLASDQLKLTMTEIRRSPWRLLYTPGKKELENELFYDSARTYAEAVSDLRAASEALEIAAATGEATPQFDRATIEQISQQITDAFERYREAETDLLDRISKSRPN